MEIPKYPMVFMKAPTATQNPGDPIVLPRFLRSDKVDFEAELGVVIGRPCKNVSVEEALSYVLGYVLAANDVSARDWQKGKRGRSVLPEERPSIPFARSDPVWLRPMKYQILPN